MGTTLADPRALLRLASAFLFGSATRRALAFALTLTCVSTTIADDPPEVAWTHQFGSAEPDITAGIAVADDGTILAAGYTMGAVGAGASAGGFDVFVQAIGPDGEPSWARQLGSGDDDFAEAIAAGPEGRIAVVGQTDGGLAGPSSGETDGFLVVLDARGVTLWERTLGTPADDVASGVAFAPDGSLVVAGWTGGDLAGSSAGGEDAFLVAFDAQGAERWDRQFGTPEDDRLRAVAIGDGGDIAVAGQTRGSLDGASGGGWDAFVRRHGADGAASATSQFGGGPDAARHALRPGGRCRRRCLRGRRDRGGRRRRGARRRRRLPHRAGYGRPASLGQPVRQRRVRRRARRRRDPRRAPRRGDRTRSDRGRQLRRRRRRRIRAGVRDRRRAVRQSPIAQSADSSPFSTICTAIMISSMPISRATACRPRSRSSRKRVGAASRTAAVIPHASTIARADRPI